MTNNGDINYCSLTDEQLVEIYQTDNDDEAANELYSRHERMIRSIAMRFFADDLDREDAFQEGVSAYLEAINRYKSGSDAQFRTFAYRCITNHMSDVIKKATSSKRQPSEPLLHLQSSVSADMPDVTLAETIPSEEPPIDDTIIRQEQYEQVMGNARKGLSEMEYSVFEMRMDGAGYDEISEKLGISHKTVDNALQRIRRKIEKWLKA